MGRFSRLAIFLLLLFSISNASQNYCSVPPFLVKGVKPNIIIVLDNSNSMDEDFYGNAVGSYSPKSKSVVAKKELIKLINRYKDKIRAGLITYKLGKVYKYYLFNSPYFVSYNPVSYCPDPPEECVKYCQTGDNTYRSICESGCKSQNPDFDVDYFDEIIETYSYDSPQRNKYCRLVYPKTQRYKNPTDSNHYLYYKRALPAYSSNVYSQQTFCYSKDYNPYEGEPYDYYHCYAYKTGTSDNLDGYYFLLYRATFVPTDSDYALGFLDFGRRLADKYVGRTWYSNSSPGDGYLHVEVSDLTDLEGNTTSTYNTLIQKLDPKENDENGYMSCRNSDKNQCSYIINAGLTPSAGTLQTVIDYLTGASSPIEYRCQKTFVIYVTDGLPSVDENGNPKEAKELLPAVLDKIHGLRDLTVSIDGNSYTFDVQTYILGVALSDDAKSLLDEIAVAGGTDVNGHAYYADNPQQLRESLSKIFEDIVRKVSSSASVATLSKKSKKGAIAVQAIFYPEKRFDDYKLTWIGYLYGYWFYNRLNAQNLREDTNQNKILDKVDDYIVEFNLDEYGKLLIDLYKSDTNGKKSTYIDTVFSLEDIKPLFETGNKLTEQDYLDRNIFTTDGNKLLDFNLLNKDSFKIFLGNTNTFPSCLGDNSEEKISNLIRYVSGQNIEGCRNKVIDSYGTTWKLGDIIYSSPKIVEYKNFSVIFVGANDGMLHAFRVGKVDYTTYSEDEIAKLQNSETDTGTDKLGEELWAFIPKNALPYLRYLPDPNYCHLYFVDLTPYIVEEKGRKILIGGMRLGGACGCSSTNCIKPPSDTCPLDSGECVGLSSYFALDITDPENPQFLWEFTDRDLGFSFSGPGIIKKRDKTYVIFASGPTNYKGDSNQNLFLYILDLYTGEVLRKIDTHIQNAFGGRLFNEGLDYNDDKETDYIALGYARKDGDMNNWKGGVLFIDISSNIVDSWSYTDYFANAQGPILTKISFMRCFKNWYAYFGSGRWFYKEDNPLSGQRERIYGVPLNCDVFGCRFNTNVADVTSSSDNVCTDAENGVKRGWYIELDPNEGNYLKERSITDPTITNQNIIAFPTTQPTSDPCGFGGRSRVWILNCATGGALLDACPTYPIKKAKGTILLQLSGGDIREIKLKEFLEQNSRTTEFFSGTLPEDSQQAIQAGRPQNKGEILLWFEK